MSALTITQHTPTSARVSVTTAAPRTLAGFPPARQRAVAAVDRDSPARDALAEQATAVAEYFRTVFELDVD